MKTIHKYTLALMDEQTLQIPAGAQILSVAEQHDRLCLWALVDGWAPKVARRIRVSGTGHFVHGGAVFIGTVLFMGGDLVLHVFEIPA